MLSGWHHKTEINRDIGTKKSFSDFKGKHKPVCAKHRILKETMNNFGTILKKT